MRLFIALDNIQTKQFKKIKKYITNHKYKSLIDYIKNIKYNLCEKDETAYIGSVPPPQDAKIKRWVKREYNNVWLNYYKTEKNELSGVGFRRKGYFEGIYKLKENNKMWIEIFYEDGDITRIIIPRHQPEDLIIYAHREYFLPKNATNSNIDINQIVELIDDFQEYLFDHSMYEGKIQHLRHTQMQRKNFVNILSNKVYFHTASSNLYFHQEFESNLIKEISDEFNIEFKKDLIIISENTKTNLFARIDKILNKEYGGDYKKMPCETVDSYRYISNENLPYWQWKNTDFIKIRVSYI